MTIMKYSLSLLAVFLCALPAAAGPVTHKIDWSDGVNSKTVEGWSGVLAVVSQVDSTTYFRKQKHGEDPLHKKKHRDVIVWVPASTDLSKPFTTVLWFHGHYGYFPSRTFGDRTLRQLVPVSKSKNLVVVIPEMPWSIHTSTPTKRNGTAWRKRGQFTDFTEQVLRILRDHNSGRPLGAVDYRVVGHSAGGSTIMRLSMTGDLCKIPVSVVVWSDSSYGSWLQKAWDGCLKNHPGIDVRVFAVKGDKPWKRARSFMTMFKKAPSNLRLFVMERPRWSHKLVGNNIVELSELMGEL